MHIKTDINHAVPACARRPAFSRCSSHRNDSRHTCRPHEPGGPRRRSRHARNPGPPRAAGWIFEVSVKPLRDGSKAVRRFNREQGIIPVQISPKDLRSNRTRPHEIFGKMKTCLRFLRCCPPMLANTALFFSKFTKPEAISGPHLRLFLSGPMR